jgi:hypothetical protein
MVHLPSLASGYSITSGGLLQGNTGSVYNQNIVVKVTDALSNNTATATLNLTVQNSTLAITQQSCNDYFRRGLQHTLTGTGGTAPYAWGISPQSANTLPSGITLDVPTGNLAGTSNQSGFNKPVTFRLMDNITAYVERTLTVQVSAGLTLKTGIDYTDSTSTGYLGYITNGVVDTINPRPNKSFYIVATGVVSTCAKRFTSSNWKLRQSRRQWNHFQEEWLS